MAIFEVNLRFEIDENITKEEFEEWFKYDVIDWGSCSGNNPLLNKDKSDLISTYDITEY